MTKQNDWVGNVKDSQEIIRQRLNKDKKQRERAGNLPGNKNIILSERDVQGFFDFGRLLKTTLGGETRPITASDLASFRRNISQAQKRLGKFKGITARQVIDLAKDTPLKYRTDPTESDFDRAKKQIRSAVALSATNGTVRFVTPSSGTTRATNHYVIVNFLGFEAACTTLASMKKNDPRFSTAKVAEWLKKQPLQFDCDCERHRYFFRYVATVGGFAAGRKETGYPKIRNPQLQGVACKHVLRVMNEILHSQVFQKFLERHLEKVTDYKASTRISQKQAQQDAKVPGKEITSTQEERQKAAYDRAKQALKYAVVGTKITVQAAALSVLLSPAVGVTAALAINIPQFRKLFNKASKGYAFQHYFPGGTFNS